MGMILWRREHGNPFQYSWLENPMGRGAWQVTVHTVAESNMTEVTYHAHTESLLDSQQLNQVDK